MLKFLASGRAANFQFSDKLRAAALVKLLRRGLKEMTAKSNTYVAAGLQFERGVGLQVGCPSTTATT